MEVYVVTRTLVNLENGYYDKNSQEPIYKTKHEYFDVQGKVFVSYIKAAKYIREQLEKENELYVGGAFVEEDMTRCDVFSIGFHHECLVHYKKNPVLEGYCNRKKIPQPSNLVKYKIETCELDVEILDEWKELFKDYTEETK